MHRPHRGLTHFRIGAGNHHSRWLVTRHFLRKARATQHACTQIGGNLRHHFVWQQAVRRTSLNGFKPFAQPHQRLPQIAQSRQLIAQARNGARHQHQIAIGYICRLCRACMDAHRIRQTQARQIARVFAGLLHGGGYVRLARPQMHRMPPRQLQGHTSTPSASAQNSNLHGGIR